MCKLKKTCIENWFPNTNHWRLLCFILLPFIPVKEKYLGPIYIQNYIDMIIYTAHIYWGFVCQSFGPDHGNSPENNNINRVHILCLCVYIYVYMYIYIYIWSLEESYLSRRRQKEKNDLNGTLKNRVGREAGGGFRMGNT